MTDPTRPDLTDDEVDALCPNLKQNAAKVRYLRNVLRLQVERRPLVYATRGKNKGRGYTYSGIAGMLRKVIYQIRAEHEASGGPLATMPTFGFRDLKGKGATDMWLAGTPIERIQLLCGHADKTTTERYIKARWRETAAPNLLAI